MKGKGAPRSSRQPPATAPDAPSEAALIATYEQNWLHIRHVETQRMLSLNAYVAILVAVIYALSRQEGTVFNPYAIVVLFFFSILNFVIAIKIEAVIQDYVARNSQIADALNTPQLAGARVRKGIWAAIRLGWLFPAFYAIAAIVLGLCAIVWVLIILGNSVL